MLRSSCFAPASPPRRDVVGWRFCCLQDYVKTDKLRETVLVQLCNCWQRHQRVSTSSSSSSVTRYEAMPCDVPASTLLEAMFFYPCIRHCQQQQQQQHHQRARSQQLMAPSFLPTNRPRNKPTDGGSLPCAVCVSIVIMYLFIALAVQ